MAEHICSHEHAKWLNNRGRRLVQNPEKILLPYIKSGMTAADIGCGPGFFTIPMARLTGKGGRVYACDLQQEMLDITMNHAHKHDVGNTITTVKCESSRIGLPQGVDFALAFYMVHETPNPAALFHEVFTCLNPGGRLLVVEPIFHVSRKEFRATIKSAQTSGFQILQTPGRLFSRVAVLGKE